MPSRRDVVSSLGAAGIVAVAGCASDEGDVDDTTSEGAVDAPELSVSFGDYEGDRHWSDGSEFQVRNDGTETADWALVVLSVRSAVGGENPRGGAMWIHDLEPDEEVDYTYLYVGAGVDQSDYDIPSNRIWADGESGLETPTADAQAELSTWSWDLEEQTFVAELSVENPTDISLDDIQSVSDGEGVPVDYDVELTDDGFVLTYPREPTPPAAPAPEFPWDEHGRDTDPRRYFDPFISTSIDMETPTLGAELTATTEETSFSIAPPEAPSARINSVEDVHIEETDQGLVLESVSLSVTTSDDRPIPHPEYVIFTDQDEFGVAREGTFRHSGNLVAGTGEDHHIGRSHGFLDAGGIGLTLRHAMNDEPVSPQGTFDAEEFSDSGSIELPIGRTTDFPVEADDERLTIALTSGVCMLDWVQTDPIFDEVI